MYPGILRDAQTVAATQNCINIAA
jgi:hypothetical protein